MHAQQKQHTDGQRKFITNCNGEDYTTVVTAAGTDVEWNG